MVQSSYNFPCPPNFGVSFVDNMVSYIYQRSIAAYKINFSFGAILQHVSTGEMVFYVPHRNNELWQEPMLISNLRDLQKLKQKLNSINLQQYVLKQRENSRYKAVLVTNCRANVSYTGFPLGSPKVELPSWLLYRNGFVHNVNHQDNLCMFRALLCHYYKRKVNMKLKVKSLFKKWVAYCIMNNIRVEPVERDFVGIPMHDVPHFERCFKINVNIYELESNLQCCPVYRSSNRFDDTLSLNKYEDHVSLITNMRLYCRKFACENCSKLFKTDFLCKRHSRLCSKQSRYVFPGGYMSQRLSIFQRLSQYLIEVPQCDRFYKFICTYDFESYLKRIESDSTDKTTYDQEHIPVSYACCSNVPGYTETHCEISDSPDELVQNMISYMYRIQEKAEELSMQKWGWALAKLEKLIELYKAPNEDDNSEGGDSSECFEVNYCEPPSKKFLNRIQKPNVYREFQKSLFDSTHAFSYNHFHDDESSEDEDGEEERERGGDESEDTDDPLLLKLADDENMRQYHYKRLQKLHDDFQKYISELVVLGFNSSRYDTILTMQYIIKHMNLMDKKAFVIKKNSAYICISNRRLRLLDAIKFMASSCTYSKFLAAYQIKEPKGFFCYDWFDSLDKLKCQSLPPIPEWFSRVKNQNVLGKTQEEMEKNYAFVKKIWEENKMQTFAQYLKHYNSSDVFPFLLALEKMLRFYQEEEDIDLFKMCISMPSAARILIYRSAFKEGAVFYQWDKKEEDLYWLFKSQICGGPSIIFCRQMECEISKLRIDGPEIVQSICGFDSNALYPYSYNFSFPVNAPIIRRVETEFEPEVCGEKYTMAYEWLDFLQFKFNCKVHHKLNSTSELHIGPYLLDGWCEDPAGGVILLEFHGCYFHGHDECDILSEKTKLNYKKELRERRERTERKEKFIRSQNYKLVTMKECRWKYLLKHDKEIQAFVLSRKPPFYASCPSKCTEQAILDAVYNGQFFGFLLCDIEVVSEWNDKFSSIYPPEIYFNEFNPLFATCKIPSSVWGSHVYNFAKSAGLSLQPRTLLIGGNRAHKILLLSDYLCWYVLFYY